MSLFSFPPSAVRIRMHLSPYVKQFEGPGSDRVLLFCTRNAAIIRLHRSVLEKIEAGCLAPAEAHQLTALGFVVEDREQEKRALQRSLMALQAGSRDLRIVSLLNLDCNFACTYCYETGLRGRHYMSTQTAEQLVAFAKAEFNTGKQSLLFDFHGGEPLLSLDLIENISRQMHTWIRRQGGNFGFNLITNGALFTPKVAERLKPLGLKGVKITLDGPAHIHNRNRPFKSGAGSFDTILRNIKATCDIAAIGIGGNFERHNYSQFIQLLDCLQSEGLTPDRIPVVKFDPVAQNPEDALMPGDISRGCISINEPWLLEAEKLLRAEILKRGYYTPKPVPIACMVEKPDIHVVNYDGRIYKCPTFAGRDEFAVGDVQTGVRDYADVYHPGLWRNDRCLPCEYLPLCLGGCRYMSFVRTGRADALDCKKEYFDTCLETLVKQDLAYRAK